MSIGEGNHTFIGSVEEGITALRSDQPLRGHQVEEIEFLAYASARQSSMGLGRLSCWVAATYLATFPIILSMLEAKSVPFMLGMWTLTVLGPVLVIGLIGLHVKKGGRRGLGLTILAAALIFLLWVVLAPSTYRCQQEIQIVRSKALGSPSVVLP